MVSGGITPTPTCDGNGNQTSAIPATLTWNALNQPITVNSTSATYDALGRMVEKGVGSTYTQFVYNPDGTNLAVYSGSLTKGTISLPGGSTAVYNASGLNFIRHKDWLGSSRLATTWAHAVYAKEAYAPFGETYNETTTKDPSFTGQDQNVVTAPTSSGGGVYDFLFRKYDPSAGRWLSPDPLGWGAVSPADPQSLNRYSYVENQPLEAVDPDGYSCITAQFNNNGTLVSVTLDDGDGKGCAAAGVLPNGTITNPWTATVNGNDADGLDPEGCDPNSNAACMPTLGGVPTYGFSGPARNGPTYSQSQVCGASAMLHGGVSFFLDAIGVIPGEGNLLSGVQLGAGILSGSITAADPESKLPDGILAGGGIALSLADMTKTASFGEVPEVLTNIVSRASFGLIPKELSVIPVIGNFASAYSAVKDWNSMWKAYHDCMGGS